MIEVEKTYKVTFTEEQLKYLYLILESKDVRGTVINPIYRELKDICDCSRNESLDEVYYDYRDTK